MVEELMSPPPARACSLPATIDALRTFRSCESLLDDRLNSATDHNQLLLGTNHKRPLPSNEQDKNVYSAMIQRMHNVQDREHTVPISKKPRPDSTDEVSSKEAQFKSSISSGTELGEYIKNSGKAPETGLPSLTGGEPAALIKGWFPFRFW
jgi:hypothetical protein